MFSHSDEAFQELLLPSAAQAGNGEPDPLFGDVEPISGK
jgi:hypothetical protein